ncbi:MAG: ferrous iron transport protein B [Bacteroidaceae bacterium]|nr:ferrous iron transport protein B [Bacteroidaceae bacterium]
MTLRELGKGQTATILKVGGEGALRQHFLDMGMIPGTQVTLQKYAPLGDPMELSIQGYMLTVRMADAEKIEVAPSSLSPSENASKERECKGATPPARERGGDFPHPGFGEEGRYHEEDEFHPISSAKKGHLTFALVGNQNCGKTTLFNQLTGSRQHVGNFPGVTIDRKDGNIKGFPEATVIDLPGIYSLSPYTSEEVISRRFILEDNPNGIINIVDATNIERNLYLTIQLMELDIPVVLALNMMDEVRNNGGTIHINQMEQMLGIPVVPISAMKNEGVDEVVRHAIHVARYQEGPARRDFCCPTEHGGAVHRCMHAIMHFIEDHAHAANLPVRFAASKLIEGDKYVTEALRLTQNEQETIEHIICQMEEERGLDRRAAIADMRFRYILKVCRQTVVHPEESKEQRRSRRIDKVLTGRYTAIPAFLLIMATVFYLTFNVVGAWLQDLFQEGIDRFTELTDAVLTQWNIAPPIHSLIIDGIYSGVGTVLVFMPLIVCLFFFLSMLEDTGYMARIAFVMDRLLRLLGLSGRSIVPLLVGLGCSVPAVMASRTLPSERDRKLTILLIPFMSCTAKIPIYAFFSAAFFPKHAAWVMMSLYVIGIVMGIVLALVLKWTWFKGEAVPFVMELPNYRMPVARNVWQLLWEKSKGFLTQAFTVIFFATIIIWLLQTFDFHLQMVPAEEASRSMLAQISSLVVPVFEPLGCGDWRVVTSLVSGLLAKEVVVSTLSTLFAGVAITEVFTPGVAYTLLVFCLLYTPCMAAMATIRRELGMRWMLIIMFGQCCIAWVVAFLFHTIISML